MAQLGIGIVGTGMIAGVIADAVAKAKNARLAAVSSRKAENAQAFVATRKGAAAVQGIDDLLARADVGAVYVAIPTVAKEGAALKAIAAGKHVLFDKPFADLASARRVVKAAADKGLAFMDATHFVHHPRTAAVKAASVIGTPRSLHTTFYFPFSDRNNIRFDPRQEPMTALGDMAWYSMRAVVEYLRPRGKVTKVTCVTERDPGTNAVIRASGLIAFGTGEASTFDVGYTAATIVMDLRLLGTSGVIGMDDFVLDWANSFAFQNPDLTAVYSYRTGLGKDATFIPTPAATPQEVATVEDFESLCASVGQRAAYAEASLKTQGYLDALWAAC